MLNISPLNEWNWLTFDINYIPYTLRAAKIILCVPERCMYKKNGEESGEKTCCDVYFRDCGNYSQMQTLTPAREINSNTIFWIYALEPSYAGDYFITIKTKVVDTLTYNISRTALNTAQTWRNGTVLWGGTIILPLLQMRKLRRRVQVSHQSHTGGKSQAPED